MKLTKAKEILTIYKADGEAATTEDLDNALQIGIESIDRQINKASLTFTGMMEPLPGETKD